MAPTTDSLGNFAIAIVTSWKSCPNSIQQSRIYRFRQKAHALGVWGAAAAAVLFLLAGTLLAESGMMGEERPLRVLLFGLGYSFVLVTFLNREDRLKARGDFDFSHRSLPVRIGDASYSIYLCHPFVLASFGHVGRWLNLTGPVAYAWLAIAYLAVIVCGMVIYATLERPVLATCRRLFIPKPAQGASR